MDSGLRQSRFIFNRHNHTRSKESTYCVGWHRREQQPAECFVWATESTAQTMVVRLGGTLGSRAPNTSAELPLIQRTRRLFMSQRRDLCGGPAETAVCSKLLTVARRGRTF